MIERLTDAKWERGSKGHQKAEEKNEFAHFVTFSLDLKSKVLRA